MRGGTVIILVGLTAVVAYSLGRQDGPTGKPSPAIVISPPTSFEKPIALLAPAAADTAVTLDKARPSPVTMATAPSSKPSQSSSDVKRKAEAVITAAAIAAILVQASRDQYHATGHPCACPDDLMRNGRVCGGRSAYSRPGGAEPLCYPSDVTAAMIEDYRKTATHLRENN
jgi:hypothetical protein